MARPSDPDPDILTTNWTFVVTGAPPSACTFGATNTLAPTVLCTDNAIGRRDAERLRRGPPAGAQRGHGHGRQRALRRWAPVTVTASPVSLSTPVNVSVPFTDAGTSDTHTGDDRLG